MAKKPGKQQELIDAASRLSGLSGRVRLGPGVLAIAAAVLIPAIASIGYLGGKLSENAAIITIAVLIFVLAMAYLAAALLFAHHNPGAAILGGGDFVRYTELRAGTKDQEIIELTPVENPALPHPTGDE